LLFGKFALLHGMAPVSFSENHAGNSTLNGTVSWGMVKTNCCPVDTDGSCRLV
jgi:hypothetical protein